MIRLGLPSALLGAALTLLPLVAVPVRAAVVYRIDIDGAIGPATAGYLGRAIGVAEDAHAELLLVRLDTPGGLLDSTRTMVQALLTAEVPVAVWVAPAGASATSAGCFLTLAADFAAMAPATTIGAAHPVQMGGAATETGSTMDEKIENFAASWIETIAGKRHRNVEWAVSAVRQSASIPAERALDLAVVDLLADSEADLLRQLDGRKWRDRTLHTRGARVVPIAMSLREKVFQVLWRPELMFVLMLVVIYGIIGELSNPGAVVPGVAGVIALILLMYLSAALPMNAAGLLLIGLAVVLFVIEAFSPTFGLWLAGGIAAFLIGALMLFDRDVPGFHLTLWMVLPATLLTAAFFLFVVGAGVRAQARPPRTGRERMPGSEVTAVTPVDGKGGKVWFDGETWQATSPVPLAAGDRARIVAVHGLSVEVAPTAQTHSAKASPGPRTSDEEVP